MAFGVSVNLKFPCRLVFGGAKEYNSGVLLGRRCRLSLKKDKT